MAASQRAHHGDSSVALVIKAAGWTNDGDAGPQGRESTKGQREGWHRGEE